MRPHSQRRRYISIHKSSVLRGYVRYCIKQSLLHDSANRNLLAPSQASSSSLSHSCVCPALNPYSINFQILFKASLFEAPIHLTALLSAVAASVGHSTFKFTRFNPLAKDSVSLLALLDAAAAVVSKLCVLY